MKLIDIVCQFIDGTKDKSESELNVKSEMTPAEAEAEIPSFDLNPREGMSLESAKLAIGRCADNKQCEIHGIENKGRYFAAKVMDSKGKLVNELLVDKLNGRVKFLR